MAMDMVLWKIKTGLNDTAGSVFKDYVTKSLADKLKAAQDERVREALAKAASDGEGGAADGEGGLMRRFFS